MLAQIEHNDSLENNSKAAGHNLIRGTMHFVHKRTVEHNLRKIGEQETESNLRQLENKQTFEMACLTEKSSVQTESK
jgi:hypothetical protein